MSFIIPAYNVPQEMLRECLTSIVRSVEGTPIAHNCEIIIIDDGSTTPVSPPETPMPVAIYRQTNQGLSAARNAGIRLATKEYIQFLDADDTLI
ncbi:MAG: glycosyltransferase family 2 protein, partial [Bacteroidaceae bacterium]|nr:glycosyltransferase family 2 protein [Bacteroidaceae bacterium]